MSQDEHYTFLIQDLESQEDRCLKLCAEHNRTEDYQVLYHIRVLLPIYRRRLMDAIEQRRAANSFCVGIQL